MNLVGEFSPRRSLLFEGGPGFARKIVFSAGAVAAITQNVTVGACSLVIVMVINFGNLN